MKDDGRTKEQLLKELAALRQKVAVLEASDRKRKKTEEALRESEERYRTLFEDSRDAIFIAAREGNILDANQAALDLFGLTREETIALDVAERYVDLADRDSLLQEIRERGSVRDYEVKLRKKDGTEIDCLITSTVRRAKDGGILSYTGIIRDISERKRAAEALRQAEERYRSIFENAVEGIFQTTPDGRFLTANPALANIYGYESPGEMLESVTNIERQLYVEPNRRAEFIRLMEEHRAVSGFEFQAYRKDGSVMWISENVRAVRDESGTVRYYEGYVQDVTEHKRAEERVHVLNELMRIAASGLDIADIFEGVGAQVKRLIDFDTLTIALHRPGADFIELHATVAPAHGFLQAGLRVPLSDSGLGEVIRTGRPSTRRNLPEDARYPREFEVTKTYGVRSLMYIPLESKGRVFGTLNFGSTAPDQYGEDEIQIAQEIADHLAVIVEHTLLHEESKDLAVLEERNRMAREIHDTLAQGFTGIVLQLEAAEQALDKRPAEIPYHLSQAKNLAKECLQEARRSVWNLLPRALEQRPLDAALEEEVRRFAAAGREKASFSLSGDRRELLSNVQANLLRICQESLTNVRRHARAIEVRVTLAFSPGAVCLEVQDNGRGFDVEAVKATGRQSGFGLAGMEERARLLGGTLAIRSQKGKGTLVEVRISIA